MNQFRIYCLIIVLFVVKGCTSSRKQADEIFYNGTVYTVDKSFTKVTAFAVKEGKIIATGNDIEILEYSASKKTDLQGKFVYPGFQDGHCHFYGYGIDLNKIWLSGTNSFKAVTDTLLKYREKQNEGWIFGRGWDQNDWEVKKYPDNSLLDSLFPDTPVFLLRIDGHAALVNAVALQKAGITASTQITGGVIEKENGKLTGILSDAAVDLVYGIIPDFSEKMEQEALLNAQEDCFAVGLTSVTDAGYESGGLKLPLISMIDSLQKSGRLKMRMNVMARIEDREMLKSRGKTKTDLLKVHSVKLYADGALGSRGACLLQPYTDQPGHYGTLVFAPSFLDSVAESIAEMGWQLNTHCIGDSSHRLMLNIYKKYQSASKEQRWRIEHAQVINVNDFSFYKDGYAIPSVQPVHATSDMYWAEDRVGIERMEGAYAYRKLLENAGIIVAGSDFPVEHINPLFGYYAAVVRKDQKNYPEKGFMMQNSLTREEALKAMTIWPAFASFSENETGSLEKNKFADFVILEKDLLTADEKELWNIKVNATYINGKRVYQRGE